MDNFDESIYQDAFNPNSDLNVEHPIVKILTDPTNPILIKHAKQHFDKLHEISTKGSPFRYLDLKHASKKLYEHFLHPPVSDFHQDNGTGTFIDHVVDSALNSQNPEIFHLGAMSPYLEPKHLEKAINSKFLDSIPSNIYGKHIHHDASPIGNIVSKVSRANTSDNTRKILIDKILNLKYTFGGKDVDDRDWRKMHDLTTLVPKMSSQNMHDILDNPLLDESNIKVHSDHYFRLRALESMARFGGESVRNKLLEKHPLLDQNEDGSLGNQTKKTKDAAFDDTMDTQNKYISSMLKYGNNEQQNNILMQLTNKNYKNYKLSDVYSKANNEQRHYLIAKFHPSAFDWSQAGDGKTVGIYGSIDQKHHFVQRHNDLNIKLPHNSYLREPDVDLHSSTKQLIRENDNIKE